MCSLSSGDWKQASQKGAARYLSRSSVCLLFVLRRSAGVTAKVSFPLRGLAGGIGGESITSSPLTTGTRLDVDSHM